MRRNTTFSRGTHIPSATLNAVQDEQVGLIPATGSDILADIEGADGRWYQTPTAGVPNGELATIDATSGLSWLSRRVWGVMVKLTAAAERMGGADNWKVNDPSLSIVTQRFEGATGTGGLGSGPVAVANGTPPVVAAGSFAVLLWEGSSSAQRVWLYATPSTGTLCLYNASGGTLHAEILLFASGTSPTDGLPPPDVIEALTEVQWLTPGTAAARPASPDGPALYRATDTGEVSLWDTGAWRSLTRGGSLEGPATTGDAAWTTVATDTVPATSQTTYVATVSAIRDDGTEGASFIFSAGFRRGAAGPPAQVGSTVKTLIVRDDISWDLRFAVSGNDVVLQVVGAIGKTIRWKANLRAIEAT